MTKNEVMALLQDPYSPKLAGKLLREIFGEAFEPVTVKAKETVIKNIGCSRRLGRVRLNGDTDTAELFEVLDIETKPEIRIEHNRLTLNKGTKEYFDGINVRGVLAFFHSTSEGAWRLTYAAQRFSFDKESGNVKTERTGAKRFTYIFGQDAAVGTAAVRLLSIRDTAYANSRHLEEAFSMEAVSKEFFDTYRSFYQRFTQILSEKKKNRALFTILVLSDAQGAADKPLRDFSKKLLGRLVFFKFLEKKGWLGADNYAAADGDREFLNHLFKSHEEKFYAEALVPLFFETLNTPRKNDVFRLTGKRIPFLNGGLFENDYPIETNMALDFPASIFKELLEFLSAYNFTIDENDAGDADIGVDPEMLGRIFEQLIEDNEKDMNGTIYTPFEVVRFMCRESLTLHLCRVLHCNRDSKKAMAIKALIINSDSTALSAAERRKLDEALKTIKVLDPAVGSGAFPMGMLKTILSARMALESGTDREQLKREIIRESIYGVDIDHGAVDIARLRFFLSLVVDAREPVPLPNLDFKLMQGDSLAEEYEGVDLCLKPGDLLDPKHKNQKVLDFSGDGETRDNLFKQITEFYNTTEHDKKQRIEQNIRFTVAEYIIEKLKEGKKLSDADKKAIKAEQETLQALLKRNAPFFLWHLYFKDVFDKGGFDIIIGNPPYRANQENENDQAKNKVYPHIYGRIKETFVAKSTAQKTKAYDLFACFFRLAMDFSLDAKRKSIIAFITNYAFIGARTYDGFRREVRENFCLVRVVNLGGDVRSNPKLSGPVNSIFGIQAGVAISFYEPKSDDAEPFVLKYAATQEEASRKEKIDFLASYDKADFSFADITPDAKENWLNQSDSDFQSLIPLCSKEAKSGKGEEKTVFKLFSLGIATNRDEWAFDIDETNLKNKVKYFVQKYNEDVDNWGKTKKRQQIAAFVSRTIKYTSELEISVTKGEKIHYSEKKIASSFFRPFIRTFTFFDEYVAHRRYQMHHIFPENKIISFSGLQSTKGFSILAADCIVSLDLIEKTQCLPLYRYEKDKKLDNITDWALNEFQQHYKDKKISKEAVFHYVYGVLHNPAYRTKYEVDLKQDYPRLPFYADFRKWVAWGRELMELHIGFEKAAPCKTITELPAPANAKPLKTHRLDYGKDAQGNRVFSGSLSFCDGSGLRGIPPRAFEYKLGNKSAIEWVLDQYVAPSYPTDEEVASGKRKIREDEKVLRDKFTAFTFADYRECVVDLIRRLTTVSLRTLEIQDMMREEE